MKIRQGFVSNSSSSSFIVAFETVPQDAEELRKMLFGDRMEFHSPYQDEFWTTQEIADIVWRDIKKGVERVELLIAEAQEKYSYEIWEMLEKKYGGSPYYENSEVDKDKFMDEYDKLIEESGERQLKNLRDRTDNAPLYRFEYSDNDSQLYSAMEHGDLFRKLPHIRISKH